jgi:hypothetical protein
LAPLAVPICTRAAIHLIGRVVSLRSRAALASLLGSLRAGEWPARTPLKGQSAVKWRHGGEQGGVRFLAC